MSKFLIIIFIAFSASGYSRNTVLSGGTDSLQTIPVKILKYFEKQEYDSLRILIDHLLPDKQTIQYLKNKRLDSSNIIIQEFDNIPDAHRFLLNDYLGLLFRHYLNTMNGIDFSKIRITNSTHHLTEPLRENGVKYPDIIVSELAIDFTDGNWSVSYKFGEFWKINGKWYIFSPPRLLSAKSEK